MRHSTLQNMLDELMEDPEEIIISSNSKHAVLYGNGDKTLILTGDFSGTPEECEAEVRRILNHPGEITA